MTSQTETIAVVGAGIMGTGIAQVCAQAGYRVVLQDVDTPTADEALERIKGFLDRSERKGMLSQNKETILSRIRVCGKLDEVPGGRSCHRGEHRGPGSQAGLVQGDRSLLLFTSRSGDEYLIDSDYARRVCIEKARKALGRSPWVSGL